MWRTADAEPGLRVSRIDTRVDLVQAFTGMTDKPLRHAIEDGAIGIALIAFGRGNVPPTIVVHPVSQEGIIGSNATFTVMATGDAPLSYQWRFGGVNLAGATGATRTSAGSKAGWRRS